MTQTGLLVVEDDPSVHQFLKEAVPLLFQGPSYFAETGVQALVIWHEHSSEIGILLTDVNLPGISGEELASSLVRKNQNLKVIVSSGRQLDLEALEQKFNCKVGLLQKPFLVSDLSQLLAEAKAAHDQST